MAPPFNTIQDTVNGTSLTAFSLTGLTDSDLGWFANGTGPTGVINYNLNGNYVLSRLGFWNIDGGNRDFGLRDVRVETSLNGVAYTPLTGAGFVAGVHTFVQGGAGINNLPEVVSFTPVLASFVRFTIVSNYNASAFPGYKAVLFDAAVPEIDAGAGTLPIAVLTVVLLLVADGRRRTVAVDLCFKKSI